MIPVGKTLVSDDVISVKFVCDLNKCKGACCVEGESGAPLEKEELKRLEEIYPVVKAYLTEEGIKAIEEKGFYQIDNDGDFVTPLIGSQGACAYTIFENGIAGCGIEKAFNEGKIKFCKPISCHLYPVRISKYKSYEAINYHEWEVCAPACKLGKKLSVPVYRFVKDALIRKYGEKWYRELEMAAQEKEKSVKHS
ncbi:MAG: DUF3109 family protein [Bacteroidia bacterium]|nr:DUF3109 family protein [Bacteroidia bacterium]MCZ2277970.1 DUF3109 family protein [Bacteroidia bacterium]